MAEVATRDGTNSELPQDMLTIREVARLLHVHANTVRKWSDRGLLKAYRIGQRRDRRFAAEDVFQFLKADNQRYNPGTSA